MRQSQLFYKTFSFTPKDEQSINATLLIRGGFIDKLAAGVYSFLPLGLRVLEKVNAIIREEMEKIGAQEVFLPALHPRSIWEPTQRWEKAKGVMYQFKDERGKEWGLGFTHEEIITELVKKRVSSFRDLPLALFQIQTKFRNEPRARSGLIRGREFLMKDLYSFHSSQEDFEDYYSRVKDAYFKIFKRCGLDPLLTEASGGLFSKVSHEFQVLTESGEDTVYYCPFKDWAVNKEVWKEGMVCPNHPKEKSLSAKAIEVGNIFPLGTFFSEAFGLYFIDRDGQRKPVIMGSYGIGPSRVIGTVVEVYHDENGIIWPQEIAPFGIHLLALQLEDSQVKEKAEEIYQNLQTSKKEVLYDDRQDKTPGEKLVEADLLGVPLRIVVSKRSLAQGAVEIKKRGEKEARLIKLSDLFNYV